MLGRVSLPWCRYWNIWIAIFDVLIVRLPTKFSKRAVLRSFRSRATYLCVWTRDMIPGTPRTIITFFAGDRIGRLDVTIEARLTWCWEYGCWRTVLSWRALFRNRRNSGAKKAGGAVFGRMRRSFYTKLARRARKGEPSVIEAGEARGAAKRLSRACRTIVSIIARDWFCHALGTVGARGALLGSHGCIGAEVLRGTNGGPTGTIVAVRPEWAGIWLFRTSGTKGPGGTFRRKERVLHTKVATWALYRGTNPFRTVKTSQAGLRLAVRRLDMMILGKGGHLAAPLCVR